jgi:hypothetical protein
MRHLKKLFESKSIESTRNLIKEFNDFLRDIKPIVFEKYLELAKDKRYEPDYGDKPNTHNIKDLALIEAIAAEEYFEFLLQNYDNNGIVQGQYYIILSNEEMEEALMKIDAKKYNL